VSHCKTHLFFIDHRKPAYPQYMVLQFSILSTLVSHDGLGKMTILSLMLLIYSKYVKFRNSNSIFLENKKIRNFFFVKRLEQILTRLAKKVFKNDIVSLVKIQIYSNSIF
jgi:hypothetical protein